MIVMAAEKKYEWNLYRLVAIPDQILRKKLEAEQVKISGEFGVACQPVVSIELANFFARPEMEATLGRWIGNICALQEACRLQVVNYHAQPPQSLYARVKDNGAFTGFFRSLKMLDGFITSCDCPPVQICSSSHILLAGGLTARSFENASTFYARENLDEDFTVEKILFLRGEGGSEVISSYRLPMHAGIK